MSTTNRITRVNELLKREIAESLFRIVHDEKFDLSAVTVTHVITSSDLKTARVLVSIRDHQAQRKRMLSLLSRKWPELHDIIRKKIVLRHIPHLTFELDESIEKGDHVLNIISQIEAEQLKRETPEAPESHEN
ncbi:MAG: 30S ribosome-binding factor RbfA [Lentisphaerota bacterium]